MSEQKIEGVPDGWRLVRIGKPKAGETFMDGSSGVPHEASCDWNRSLRAIIEKIEKPKKYRPFANAAEFEPHRDRWVTCIEGGVSEDVSRVTGYDDFGVFVGACDDRFPYDEALKTLAFEDLEPFGVEVTE